MPYQANAKKSLPREPLNPYPSPINSTAQVPHTYLTPTIINPAHLQPSNTNYVGCLLEDYGPSSFLKRDQLQHETIALSLSHVPQTYYNFTCKVTDFIKGKVSLIHASLQLVSSLSFRPI